MSDHCKSKRFDQRTICRDSHPALTAVGAWVPKAQAALKLIEEWKHLVAGLTVLPVLWWNKNMKSKGTKPQYMMDTIGSLTFLRGHIFEIGWMWMDLVSSCFDVHIFSRNPPPFPRNPPQARSLQHRRPLPVRPSCSSREDPIRHEALRCHGEASKSS